jgi:hypothetical protein
MIALSERYNSSQSSAKSPRRITPGWITLSGFTPGGGALPRVAIKSVSQSSAEPKS